MHVIVIDWRKLNLLLVRAGMSLSRFRIMSRMSGDTWTRLQDGGELSVQTGRNICNLLGSLLDREVKVEDYTKIV